MVWFKVPKNTTSTKFLVVYQFQFQTQVFISQTQIKKYEKWKLQI